MNPEQLSYALGKASVRRRITMANGEIVEFDEPVGQERVAAVLKLLDTLGFMVTQKPSA